MGYGPVELFLLACQYCHTKGLPTTSTYYSKACSNLVPGNNNILQRIQLHMHLCITVVSERK